MSKKRIITMVKKVADENMKVAIDREDFVNYSIDLMTQTREQDAKIFFTAYLKALRDLYGFGETRLERLHWEGVRLVSEYMNNPEKWKADTEELVSLGLKVSMICGEEKIKNV